mgnify:CR=1 FL=1
MWYTATSASVSVTTNPTIVSIATGDDISIIQEDSGLIFEGESPVQVKRGYIDGSGNKFIELQSPWPYSTKTNQPLVAYPTDASFAEATAELRRVIDSLEKAGTTDAQAGTDDEKFMTALKTKQSIDFNTGTAAAADVTTSVTDTTAGRVVKVGDFSLGGNLIVAVNPNEINKTYSTRLPNTVEGIGYMPQVGYYTMDTAAYDSNSGHQLAKDLFDRQMYHRTKQGEVWDDEWIKIFDSGNTNFNEFGGLAANDTIGVAGRVTNATAALALPINSKVAPTSLTRTGSFNIIRNGINEGAVTSLTLTSGSSNKVAILEFGGVTFNQGDFIQVRTVDAESKIKVNF